MQFRKQIFILILSFTTGVLGCAAKPTIFLGTYGTYTDRSAGVQRLLAEHELETRLLEVDPPPGISGSVIIYGRSKFAETTANDIAYLLYTTFGEWIAVRPVEVTNHRYSSDYLGIYLLDSAYVEQELENDTNSIAVVATNEYVVQDCENYAASLRLEGTHGYSIYGVEFDSDGRESVVSIAGSYRVEEGQLTLENGGVERHFRRELVQLVVQEPIKRVKYIPVSDVARGEDVFWCSFLQELAVLVQE